MLPFILKKKSSAACFEISSTAYLKMMLALDLLLQTNALFSTVYVPFKNECIVIFAFLPTQHQSI
jgi:hypothetical protein